MSKRNNETLVIPVAKPRNPLVALARARKAGKHVETEVNRGKQRRADLRDAKKLAP